MRTRDKKQTFFLNLVLVDGTFRVSKAKKSIGINQYRRTWKPINARKFARTLNKSNILIK